MSKLDNRIKVIKFHHKTIETIFTLSPDEENIVNLPKPYKRLKHKEGQTKHLFLFLKFFDTLNPKTERSCFSIQILSF